jgi:hypothetical protein
MSQKVYVEEQINETKRYLCKQNFNLPFDLILIMYLKMSENKL